VIDLKGLVPLQGVVVYPKVNLGEPPPFFGWLGVFEDKVIGTGFFFDPSTGLGHSVVIDERSRLKGETTYQNKGQKIK